ncbi:MAG: histidinol dehydrogenase [Sphingomonas sp.]|nr:histidinol dehydrogenase [Sphingomonas sp.]
MIRLSSSDPGFDSAFTALVNARREADADVSRDVAAIVAKVRSEGDRALRDYTSRFDRHDLEASGWEIGKAERSAALANLDPELRKAIELAAERIGAYHAAQKPEDRDHVDATGVRLGARWNAVEAAGLYVPGGRAAYPSTVLMNAIPARVAGVERLVMVTPTPDGEVNDLVLAAAEIAGVDEVWRVGGAQAIAALAYGTDHIRPVDVIVGPGNAWVAEAKRQLYGVVGIDMVAGPSEIVVVADAQNDPAWIAADLLSQAEHDPTSQSILFTDDAAFGHAVERAVGDQLAGLATGNTAAAAWNAYGAVIVVPTLAAAVPLDQVRHAGSVFLGRYTPEAIGDYIAGPNHVLPTGRRARFASGLSVLDFMKRTSFIACTPDSLAAIGPAAVALAHAEGLPAHAASVEVRL